jgi:hypothetical protein
MGRTFAVFVGVTVFLGSACIELALVLGGARAFVPRGMFVRGFRGIVFEELRDGRLDASESGGGGALVHYTFEFLKSSNVIPSSIFLVQVVADARAVENGGLLRR